MLTCRTYTSHVLVQSTSLISKFVVVPCEVSSKSGILTSRYFSLKSPKVNLSSLNIHIIFQLWNQHPCWLSLSVYLEVPLWPREKEDCYVNNTLYTAYTTQYP